MDDANLPSLLSIPLMPYSTSPSANAAREEIYLKTRLFALSTENGYWMHGNVMSAIGGPILVLQKLGLLRASWGSWLAKMETKPKESSRVL